ncbi:MAG: hypothetical protein HXX16_19065 [Bacteroidales bacterium]|nr:hypothetical protein [Bacteroidales bacterium]
MKRTENLKTASEHLKEAQQLLLLAIVKENISSIERDLILEKLRKVYDSLLFDNDVEKKMIPTPVVSQPIKIEKVAEIPSKPSAPEIKPQIKTETSLIEQKVEVSEKPKVFERTSIFDPVKKVVPEKIEEENVIDVKTSEIKQPKKPSILDTQQAESLAEKFQGKSKFMTDSLSNQIKTKPVAAKLQDKPIFDLTKEIGVHDKFIFIKELFDGDGKLYEDTINKVNQFDDITEALIYIQENFSWNENSKTVNKFIDLIRRKLLND